MSWPGNFCLDCGYDDPNEGENALVDCLCVSVQPKPGCQFCSGTGCRPNPNLEVEPCPGPPMVIFLDFDGVLHPLLPGEPEPERLFEGSKHLREVLIKYPCTRLVIHSSWRMWDAHSDEDLWDLLEMEDSLRPRYLGVTPRSEPSRWESIQRWMKDRPYTGAYVILDDMYTSFDYEGRDHLICPAYDVGMQPGDWEELERRINAHLQS